MRAKAKQDASPGRPPSPPDSTFRSAAVAQPAGLTELFRTGRTDRLDRYSEICLRRVWTAQRFSWWMTSMLHRQDATDLFQLRVQLAELAYVTSSRAGATALAENYVRLPLE